jgi:hypothetical protein
MPTSKYQDDQVEEMYNITEAILEEERKGVTNTSKWETGTVWLMTNHTETLLVHTDWEGFLREVNCSSTFVKGIALSSPTYGLRRPRENYTWKAPDQSQHQQDDILVKHQFRDSKKDVQAMHRADIYSTSGCEGLH